MDQQPNLDQHLKAVFGETALEVVDYFARKRLQPSNGWQDVSAAAHQTAFTVAQTTGFNVLADIYDALQKARDDQWSHTQFQAHLEPLLKSRGWWGRAIDPMTGEILKMYPGTHQPVMYGSAPRLRLIYDTNMASSYAAGRYARQVANKKAFPYLRYVAVMDVRTRHAHKAWHGQIWPIDHPFWETHYPPNGFRCRCTAQSVANPDPNVLNTGGASIEKTVTVNAAGDTMRVRGWKTEQGMVSYPDPGFDVTPSNRTAQSLTALAYALTRLPPSALEQATKTLILGDAFASWKANPKDNFPIAVIPKVGKISSHTINLSPQIFTEQERHHSDVGDDVYLLVQSAIMQGRIIQDETNYSIYLYSNDKLEEITIIKITKNNKGEKFLNSIKRIPKNAQNDKELIKLLQR